MGFGNMRGKGHHNELALFDTLINSAESDQLDAFIQQLQSGIRLMDALLALAQSVGLTGVTQALTDWIDRHWFCKDGESMWVITSERSPGEIHAMMRTLAIDLATIAKTGAKIDMYAQCKLQGTDIEAHNFHVKYNQNGNVVTVNIYGPYNMSEGGGILVAAAQAAAHATHGNSTTAPLASLQQPSGSPAVDVSSEHVAAIQKAMADPSELIEVMEHADPRGEPVYMGTPMGMSCDDGGDYPSEGKPQTAQEGGSTVISWPGSAVPESSSNSETAS